MRLSIFVATLLFVETFGFSTLTTQQRASSSLALLIRPEESTKSKSPAEILAKIQASRTSDIENILSTLEKRIDSGPGSLSVDEVEQFKIVGDKILGDLKNKKESDDDELSGWPDTSEKPNESSSTAPAAASPVVQEEPLVQVTPEDSLLPDLASFSPLLPDLTSFLVPEDELKVEEDSGAADPIESLLPKLTALVASEEDIAIDPVVPASSPAPTTTTTTSSSTSVGRTTTRNDSDLPEYAELHNAALQLDSTKVASLIESGLQMDESTTSQAFWAVVRSVDNAEKEDQPLSEEVPRMLHHIFDADLDHLITREKNHHERDMHATPGRWRCRQCEGYELYF
jgi:hypothetical protein